MMRCEHDEDFRRNCVVMLPVYEQGFAIDRPIVAYNVFERPLPGIMPSRLPRLFIEESLTYRTSWKGTELGELVSSINLAPGEEREISITQSFQEERSSSETRTSVSEINSSSSTDIATEMETIARTENEFSAHAEGSQASSLGGAIAGSASSRFSFGASDTLKTFGQSMNKVAKKAATSITKKNQLEVSSTSSTTTTVSSTDSTVIKMSNINKGRTLNLMFYRVYNRYAAGLFVENLRFGVTSAVELIAGSGIYETRTFRPDRVGEMLDMLRRTPLPFNTAPSAIAQYQGTILETVLGQMHLEYLAAPAQDGAKKGGVLTGAGADPSASDNIGRLEQCGVGSARRARHRVCGAGPRSPARNAVRRQRPPGPRRPRWRTGSRLSKPGCRRSNWPRSRSAATQAFRIC